MQNDHDTYAHYWIIAPYRRDREEAAKRLHAAGEVTYSVNCHQRLRGPYSGTGELLRELVPAIYSRWPELVDAHSIEILSIAPELKQQIKVSPQTLTSLAIPEERTRFYSRLRTLRLAHGLIDFLHEYIACAGIEHCTLVFENMHMADPLDQEFVALLLRRARRQRLSLIVGTTALALPAQFQEALEHYALLVYAEPMTPVERQRENMPWNGSAISGTGAMYKPASLWRGEWEALRAVSTLPLITTEELPFDQLASSLVRQCSPTQRLALARSYVESDCTAENLLEQVAYDMISSEERKNLHNARAVALEAQGQWSLHLGALPYHRERGHDPEHAGVEALVNAANYCLDMGYYAATLDFGRRGRALVSLESDLPNYWLFTTRMTTSLGVLERPDEAEVLYRGILTDTSDPTIHMHASYAMAMLYTRHYTQERRDHPQAKRWMQTSIALARMLPTNKENAFHLVFQQNGLALVELHSGKPREALRLVSEGLEHLNRVLDADEHRLHRSVLLYNRAQVYAGLGEVEQALDDYTEVIAQDPHYSEYYFDRGNLYRRLERKQEALQDYQQAIIYSPPYPEVYYNRAGLLVDLEREEEALADYNYVLELLPDHLDALLNRASILYEREDYDGAWRDVEHGLKLDEHNAQLLCIRGLLEMAAQQPASAYDSFTLALTYDADLFAAWSNRGVLAFEQGDIEASIADLTHALSLNEDAAVYYNRAYAYQAQGQWQQAIADYTRAMTLAEDEVEDALAQRDLCYAQLAQ